MKRLFSFVACGAISNRVEYSALGVRRHNPADLPETGTIMDGAWEEWFWSQKGVTPSGDWWPRWIKVGKDIQPAWVQIGKPNTPTPKPDPEFSLSIPPAPVPPVPEAK